MNDSKINKESEKINSGISNSMKKENKQTEILSKGFIENTGFQKAIEKQNNLTEKIIKSIPPISFDSINQNQKIIENVLKGFNFSLYQSNALSSIALGLKNTLDLFNKNAEIMANAFSSLNTMVNQMSELFERTKIALPKMSQEEIEEREKAIEKWGKQGWVMILNAPVSFHYKTFETQKEADAYARKFFDNDELEILFKDIIYNTKQKKLCSLAIKDFKDRRYHSSAIIILSIIDRILSEKFKTNDGKKAIGARAVMKYEKQYCLKKGEGLFIGYMLENNLRIVLFDLYADTDNFTKYRDKMNRHNLIHGWQIKKVSRTDCLKLLLILNNLQFVLKN